MRSHSDMAVKLVASTPFAQLQTELDEWLATGCVASFWWRDDDATSAGPKLERLVELTAASGLLLAVIPARLQPDLVPLVVSASHVWIGQHGYAHINHAPRGQGLGAWELGLHRDQDTVLGELAVGRAQLESAFGPRFMPVVIPPWNHIDPALLAPLAERHYQGVSFFGPCNAHNVQHDFVVANAHCDPVHWKAGPRFTGEAKAVNQLLEHLAARRSGTADVLTPTGILTHHIDLDDASWAFCERLEQLITRHPAACWCTPPAVFDL